MAVETSSISRLERAAAWFVLACSLIVLAIWVLGIVHKGWTNELRSFRGPTGIVGAAMLGLVSFMLTSRGRTKKALAVGTIVLGVWVMTCGIAGLVFPPVP